MFDENFTVIPVICHFDWDIRFGGDMYQNYSWELIFILGVLIGCAATALYFQRKMLEDRVSELEKQNEKIRAANKNRLPFQTAEDRARDCGLPAVAKRTRFQKIVDG